MTPLPLRRALLLALCALLILAVSADGASESGLRSKIGSSKAREQTLGNAAARLLKLERASAKEVAIIEGRLAEAQAELDAAQGRLDRTQADLAAERRRLARLKKRLAESRARLTDLLRARYMSDKPDLVTVVLNSHGFGDLLERMEFYKRVEDADTEILDVVKAARADAGRETIKLTRLEVRRQQETLAVHVRRKDRLVGQIAHGNRDLVIVEGEGA